MARRKRSYDLLASDYPPRHGPPARSLVICTLPRSGSTLLGEAVYFAGGLGCPLEYFSPGFLTPLARRWETKTWGSYVRQLHRLRTDPSGVFAVKLFYEDLWRILGKCRPGKARAPVGAGGSPDMHRRIHEALLEVCPRPVFVRLTRRDTARQAVSLHIASATQAWRHFEDGWNPPEPDYDFENISRRWSYLKLWDRAWDEFLSTIGADPYELAFEDLVEDYEGALRDLFAALGRPDAPVVPPRLQRQSDGLSDDFVRRFRQDAQRGARG